LQLSGKIYPIIIFIAMLFMSQTEIEKPVKINSYFGFYDKAENAVLKIALRDLWSRVGMVVQNLAIYIKKTLVRLKPQNMLYNMLLILT